MSAASESEKTFWTLKAKDSKAQSLLEDLGLNEKERLRADRSGEWGTLNLRSNLMFLRFSGRS